MFIARITTKVSAQGRVPPAAVKKEIGSNALEFLFEMIEQHFEESEILEIHIIREE